MLEVIWFILKCVIDFLKMLFSVDVGFTNLGVVMCVCFIFLPMVLTIVNFLKVVAIDEFDDKHDFGRLFGYGKNNGYIGKHEYSGRHSRAYFERRRK